MAEHAPLVFSSETDKDALARARDRGELVRLATGIYTSELDRPIEDVARKRLWEIVARVMPGAVIVDRSVRDGGAASDGHLYVVARRRRPLLLPGIAVVPRSGVGPLPGDMELPHGLFMSGPARGLLENLAPTRTNARGVARTLTRAEVERWVNELAARGDDYLNRLRDEAQGLATALDAEPEMATLDALVSAALLTNEDIPLESVELRSRRSGAPIDIQRVEAFTNLAAYLGDLAPDVLPALPQDTERRRLLPFYEAYFSNYIEGTEFTLDEAAEIVFDHVVPAERPADAHDVIGTYELTSSYDEMRRLPASADDLLDLLRRRHSVIMGGRPDKAPGRFKERANRAGATLFVDPSLVDGTLSRGFDIASDLVAPFARAVYLMFLVSEVHPFADGNGRTARVMMNAELEAAGELRIIIPTVYRLNYLSALKAATHNGNYGALVATLAFARRWTSRVDFTSRATAEADLERTHALRDAREAEDAGIRLVLP